MIYQVEWRIDVDAATAKEAAIKARAAQVRPGTLATVSKYSRETITVTQSTSGAKNPEA